MKWLSTALLASAIFAVTAASSNATILYSQDFSSSGFTTGVAYSVSDAFTDRWATASFKHVKNYAEWKFHGDVIYVVNNQNGDGAILINEGAAGIDLLNYAELTATGLVSGATYVLSFLQSGDNVPGHAYAGGVRIDGSTKLTYTGIDGAAGTSSGTERSVAFTATSSSVVIDFTEMSTSDASPIIDNVVITLVPEPSSLPIFGFALSVLASAGRIKSS